MKDKLAIFDLDGTLFDTNIVNFLAYNKALNEYGKSITLEYYIKFCNGHDYREFLPKFNNDDKIINDIHNKKKFYYSQYLPLSLENKSLFEIINCLKNEYFLSVVTTASKENALSLLKYHNKEDLFDSIISKEDVACQKPAPEGFNRAMKIHGVSPKNAIIFEDSDNGITAANRTCASVYRVSNDICLTEYINNPEIFLKRISSFTSEEEYNSIIEYYNKLNQNDEYVRRRLLK